MKHKFTSLMAMSIFFLTVSHAVGFQATFTPSISISEEYTDNMDLTDNNEEYEYITSVSPGFSFQVFEKNIRSIAFL